MNKYHRQLVCNCTVFESKCTALHCTALHFAHNIDEGLILVGPLGTIPHYTHVYEGKGV